MHAASLLSAMAATGFSTASLAAPPLTTDDASTLDPGACQVEIERRRFNRQTELDIVPACNFIGDTELSIGKLRVVAEAFGQQAQPQAAQLGLRWLAVPKYLQLTTSIGAQRGLGMRPATMFF